MFSWGRAPAPTQGKSGILTGRLNASDDVLSSGKQKGNANASPTSLVDSLHSSEISFLDAGTSPAHSFEVSRFA